METCCIFSSQLTVDVLILLLRPCASYYERERRRKIDAALEGAKNDLERIIDKKCRGVNALRRLVPRGPLSESIATRCRSNPKFAKLTSEEKTYFAGRLFEHGCVYCHGSAPSAKDMERHLNRVSEQSHNYVPELPVAA